MDESVRVSALLDASVLVPAVLRDTLLRAAAAGLYSVWFSEAILEEVQRALVTNGFASSASAKRMIAHLRSYFWFAFSTDYESRISAMTNHPGDRHVLAAAVSANVGIIVTANYRHFPESALEPHTIIGMSPDTFLVMLLQHDARAIVAIVAQQAAALKSPPLTVQDVLEGLRIHAPTFVERVSTLIDTDKRP